MTEEYLEELVQKYAGGSASDEEIRRLVNWYQSYSIDEVQWPASTPGEKQEVYNKMLQRLHLGITSEKSGAIRFLWQKVAAAIVLVIGTIFIIYQFTKSSTANYLTVINLNGQIKEVQLPDGSKVWLNAATELHYGRSFEKTREVELEGEAYFEVTHDAAHPFHVNAGGVQTTVLGTRFNIKAYKAENTTTVSLVSGSVRVSNSKALAVLKPSTQLSFDRRQQKATTATIDTNSVLAWKQGRLQFDGVSLAEIANSLERWYDVKIVFDNPALKNCRYYMSFDNNTPIEKTLLAMSELTGMRYRFDKETITISGKECP